MLNKDVVWDLIILEWDALQRLCLSDHDCFGFAVLDRVESICANYNGRSSLRTYVFNTARWYVTKYYKTLPAYRAAHGQIVRSLTHDVAYTQHNTSLELNDILSQLSVKDRKLLIDRYVMCVPLKEMAVKRHTTKHKLLHEICQVLRSIKL